VRVLAEREEVDRKMNRRDFLKMGWLSALGLLLPKCATERIGVNMPVGDILKKIAEGKPTSRIEVEELRLWGNETQLLNAYTVGLQTGKSNVSDLSIQFPIGVIYSSSLASTVASVDVPISGEYKHLWVITHGRIDGSGVYNSGLNAYVNDDTGNNYNHQNMSANGTVNSAQQVLSNVQFRVGFLAGGGTAAGRASGSFCIIPHYNGSTFKHAVLLGSATNASDDTNVVADSIWNNTNAIKKLTFYAATGDNIASGSVISVYGLK
jgi:hypothetical protein